MTTPTRRRVRIATVGLMVLLPSAAPGTEPAPAATPAERRHEVRPGDTLWSIGRRYGVSIEALVSANGLPSPRAPLRVGRRLVVPGRPLDGSRGPAMSRYGLVVRLEHRNGFVTVYAHNTENLVEVGQRVASGQPIARVGRSGRATTDHLHFEIRRGGLAYNPLFFLPLPSRLVWVEGPGGASIDHDE